MVDLQADRFDAVDNSDDLEIAESVAVKRRRLKANRLKQDHEASPAAS
jgi:hypothetical protein